MSAEKKPDQNTTGRVAIAGGTGFIGAYLAAWFLSRGHEVVALARPRGGADPRSRVLAALEGLEDFGHLAFERLTVLPFETREGERFGGRLGVLLRDTPFINTVASLKHGEPHKDEILETNVHGTRSLLRRLQAVGARRLYHVSTAYVCGKGPRTTGRRAGPAGHGVVLEKPVDPETTEFNNLYEQSKARGEQILLSQSTLPVDIFRPSIVIGSSLSGWARNFTGYYSLYAVVEMLAREIELAAGAPRVVHIPLRLGGDPRVQPDVVPVDYVAETLGRVVEADLSRGRRRANGIFHLVSRSSYTTTHYLDAVQRHLGVEGIRFVLPEEIFEGARPALALEKWSAGLLRFNSSYTVQGIRFDDGQLRRVLGPAMPVCPQPDEALLDRVNDHYALWLRRQPIHDTKLQRRRALMARLIRPLLSRPDFRADNGLDTPLEEGARRLEIP